MSAIAGALGKQIFGISMGPLGVLASLLGGKVALCIYFKGVPSMVKIALEKQVVFFISIFGAALATGDFISFLMGRLLSTTPTGLDTLMITPR